MTTGCASHPTATLAASVSDEPYKFMDCTALRMERDRAYTTLQAVSDDQQSKANRDVVAAMAGAVINPIFYLLLTGETVGATEVARLKGELEAVGRVMGQKSCAVSAGH